jgi:hypothetical protein
LGLRIENLIFRYRKSVEQIDNFWGTAISMQKIKMKKTGIDFGVMDKSNDIFSTFC